MNTYKLLQGGLYRCSIAFLDAELARRAETGQSSVEGESLKCPHCKDRIILRDGVWQWDTADGLATYYAEAEAEITAQNG